MRKPLTIPKLKKKLDTVFSRWVRLSETDNGWGRCVTCGRTKMFKELDAGHFISRNCTPLRWDIRNVHIQCQRCNRFLGGQIEEYFLWMENEYGRDVVDEMISRKHDMFKLKRKWLEEQIEILKKKIEAVDK